MPCVDDDEAPATEADALDGGRRERDRRGALDGARDRPSCAARSAGDRAPCCTVDTIVERDDRREGAQLERSGSQARFPATRGMTSTMS